MAKAKTKEQQPKEIRISDDYTIQLVTDVREPADNTPARTIQRVIHEYRTMKQVLGRQPQPVA